MLSLNASADHADAGGDLEGDAVARIWALVAGDADVDEGAEEDVRVRGAVHPEADELLSRGIASGQHFADPAIVALPVGAVARVSVEAVAE